MNENRGIDALNLLVSNNPYTLDEPTTNIKDNCESTNSKISFKTYILKILFFNIKIYKNI